MLLTYASRSPRGCRPPKRPERAACCIHPDVPIDRPDPAIYSQKRALAAGQSPTWDSPDILTNRWAPFDLLSEAKVTVHNRSTTASAANVQVALGFSPFGIGMPVAPLSSVVVSLPPAGSAQLNFPLSQALLDGDPLVAVFARIVHSADADQGNNEGAQAIIGGQTSVTGRDFTFDIPVRNPANFAQTLSFITFANTLGFTVSPTSHAFAPFEQIVVKGKIKVAPGIHHSTGPWIEQSATMAALNPGGDLIGGVTYVVKIDD